MSRYARKIDENQPEIVEALRRAGCLVQSLHEMGKGIPDLLVYSRRLGQLMLLEVKDGSKPPSARKLTPLQEGWRRMGWPVAVVETVEQALCAVGLKIQEMSK